MKYIFKSCDLWNFNTYCFLSSKLKVIDKRVFNKLNMLGLGHFWNNANIFLTDFPIIKPIIRDIYRHQLRTWLTESSQLDCYRKFKLNFEFESYLVNVKNDAHRKTLHTLNFRVLSRTLAVETGRYIGIERNVRHVVHLNNQKQSISFC